MGTFICDLIDHIREEKLEYKYRNEIHANEVAILPYYISNLNIEYTYAQKMGKYACHRLAKARLRRKRPNHANRKKDRKRAVKLK